MSNICGQSNYFYEMVEIDVSITDEYRIHYLSPNISASIYWYEYAPRQVILQSSYQLDNQNDLFPSSLILTTKTVYVLIFSTLHLSQSNNFSIVVYGPSQLNFTRIGMYEE